MNTARLTVRGEVLDTKTSERPRRKGFLRRKLGMAAAYLNYGIVRGYQGFSKIEDTANAPTPRETFATTEKDGKLRRIGKFLGRQALRVAAVAPFVAAGAMLANNTLRDVAFAAKEATDHSVTIPWNNAVAESALIAIDGRGGKDGTNFGNFLVDTNQATPTAEVRGVEYPAEIGPLDATRMDVSTDIGAADATAKYNPADGKTEMAFYSEGNAPGIEAVNEIIEDNSGTQPDNLHVSTYGNPYHKGGVFDHPIAKKIEPMLDDMGIVNDLQTPAGADDYYWKYDFWANSGNQTGTTNIRQLGNLAVGGHAPYNPAEATATYNFTDEDGVNRHVGEKQYDPLVQTAIDMFHIPDPDSLNKALDMVAPIGINPDVQVQPDYDNGSVAFSEAVQKNFGIYLDPEFCKGIMHFLNGIPQQLTGVEPGPAVPIGDPNILPPDTVITGPGEMPIGPPLPPPAPEVLPPAPDLLLFGLPPAPEQPPLPEPIPTPFPEPLPPPAPFFPPAPEFIPEPAPAPLPDPALAL